MIIDRIDRAVGGKNFDLRIAEARRTHASTRRMLAVIAWILSAELVVGLVAIVVVVALAFAGEPVSWVILLRSSVVFGITVTLFYFLWRASVGYYWAYSRLLLFSLIFPIVTVSLALIPGLFPLWMIAQQVVFSAFLLGVAGVLVSRPLRGAFAKTRRCESNEGP